MIVDTINASAPIHHAKHWGQINWPQCETRMKKLQARIVKAVQDKRWNRAKALQRLLTRGFSGKALAIKRVTSNKGKNTAGVDGKVWTSQSACWEALLSLKQRGYKTSPLRRVYIPKKSGDEKRPLSIPTMYDRAMQALYLLGLDPVSETTADKYSYGFRKERSTADAIRQIFITVADKNRASWFLEGDIKKCFDTISHDWLLNNIPMETKILRKWLKAGYMENGCLLPSDSGTPQGGIISPVLANMALDGLEAVLSARFGNKGAKKRKQSKVHLIRYADDFIITGNSKEILDEEVTPLVQDFLAKRNLALNMKKTRTTSIEEGVDFLGQNIRKYNGKLIIKPSNASIKSCLKKIREIIKRNASTTQYNLIELINPVIRGWANYHRKVCASKAFGRLDHEVFTSLWRWAKRRHPEKGLRWIKTKYFKSSATRRWVFQSDACEKSQAKQLFYASDIKIRYHRKTLNAANPYDPKWYEYFAKRKKYIASDNLHGKARTLWLKQRGVCPKCKEVIIDPLQWFILNQPRAQGSKGYNSMLLHKQCRNANNYLYERPVPTQGGFKQLEPYDGKLSRTVLRGGVI